MPGSVLGNRYTVVAALSQVTCDLFCLHEAYGAVGRIRVNRKVRRARDCRVSAARAGSSWQPTVRVIISYMLHVFRCL